MVRAIADVATDFQMPGLNMPNFRKNAMILAKHGIYDLRQHLDEVLMPVLRKWNIFERNDFSGEGERDRDRLAAFVQDLEAKATKFEESRDRLLAREAARAEKAS
jgi:acyl-[acyl-carrier-protein] desaturase